MTWILVLVLMGQQTSLGGYSSWSACETAQARVAEGMTEAYPGEGGYTITCQPREGRTT